MEAETGICTEEPCMHGHPRCGRTAVARFVETYVAPCVKRKLNIMLNLLGLPNSTNALKDRHPFAIHQIMVHA